MTMTKGVESGDEEGEEKDFSSHRLVEENLPFSPSLIGHEYCNLQNY
jgi:hypothetical protein